MLGMEAEDEDGVAPAKKRTSIVTKSPSLVRVLSKQQRNGEHRHVALMNGRAKACEEYPSKFCKIVLNAMRKDLSAIMSVRRNVEPRDLDAGKASDDVFVVEPGIQVLRSHMTEGHIDVTHEFVALMEAMDCIEKTESLNSIEEIGNLAHEMDGLYNDYDFVDDISGKQLDKALAITARQEEIKFFRDRQVYHKVPRSEAWGHKIIRTKWLDVNKGDKERPNY